MNKLTTTHPTRESWLQAAVTHLRAMFAAKNFVVPDCQVSCGFTSTGVRSGHIGQYPTPASCEVHVGEQDWQSNPVHVAAFGKQLGLAVTIVPQAGHMLGKSYVSALLDRWL